MNRVEANEANCCGCGACMNACPFCAISMQADEKGFLYPVVDEMKCVDCGMCTRSCPIATKKKEESTFHQRIFALQLKDRDLLKKSTSGGAFSLFAEDVLKDGGVVFGAVLNAELKVRHIGVSDVDGLSVMRGSKYVQSDTEKTFSEVLSLLKDGRRVMYTGTPCQVDGLTRFLDAKGVSRDKLLTVDLLCHGVPSPKVWHDYTKYLERKHGARLKDYKFRTKLAGWENSIELAEFENGKKIKNAEDIRAFLSLFYKNASLRPLCYTCPYTTYERSSDITIGDFWGIDKTHPELNDNRGISVVLINTKKGLSATDLMKENAVVIESDKDSCKQQALMNPAQQRVDLDAFWSDYEKFGFDYIAEKYAKRSRLSLFKVRLITFLYKIKLLKYFKKILGR